MTNQQAPVHFDTPYHHLDTYIKESGPSGIFILVDENTHQYCLPPFLSKTLELYDAEVIEVPAGEAHKQIETCSGVWNALSELGCDRNALLINLGGGVVTDMGGFIAGTFMRGISFINIPTTLLSMVDASVGGKTGVDLGALKNQVGLIIEPEMVLIDSDYLKTLPARELRSGLAEMLKHGLIKDKDYWDKLRKMADLTLEDLEDLIRHSVKIKSEVVSLDPREGGLRKILNFGHTLGHAIETHFLKHEQLEPLLHGEAIAIGMIMEAYLSTVVCELPLIKAQEIKDTFLNYFDKTEISIDTMSEIISLLKYDKKNASGVVKFVLLAEIGKAVRDQEINNDMIFRSLEFYNS
ncbi:3-dehydroquinate synthase [Robertkochia marina]|uniref:3-dehydroquinate synthase n=1 Tax=Robertkochia marina TaxID=1227945 RepID=A0A4S3M0J9_9FLAO|nr:3-dehydroquinate synthase [Robertkochia marina]THD67950.1 3-dehydroquinate synthase [Robertkochia marina]TRZ41552.1 3-dehydroquinate synthase [Robertkochia marina]